MDKILIASPVRQEKKIFNLYCDCLDMMIEPDNVDISRNFIFHNCNDTQAAAMERYSGEKETLLGTYEDDSAYDTESQNTHVWTPKNFDVIVDLKNAIVKYAKDNEFNYIFWVDSDLLVNPFTLYHLYNYAKSKNINIISEVFWTRWTDRDIQKMPNAWMFDNYGFNNPDELFGLKNNGVYKVGGTGACILINTSVYNEFVNYSKIQNVSFSFWEDRAFCIRAACQNHDIWVDTNFPAFHVYRKADEAKIEKCIEEYKTLLDNKQSVIEKLNSQY